VVFSKYIGDIDGFFDTVLRLFSSSNDSKKDNNETQDKSDRKEENKKPLSNDGLSKLLRGNIDVNSVNESISFNKEHDIQKQQEKTSPIIPPSLADINSNRVVNDSNGVRNIAYVTKTEEEELSKKREILYNFQKLRKLYPAIKIPEFSDHTDIKTLEREYAFIIKDLEVNSCVETYKNYLILAFKGLELLLVNYMDFEDIKGFADQQLLAINKYESILMEIGERNYIAENKKWPAEVRLLGVFFMQAAMFLGTRYAMKMMNKTMNPDGYQQHQQQQQPRQQQQRSQEGYQNTQFDNLSEKRKMRGPDIDFEEFQSNKKLN